MVTALDQPADRVRGLEAGADDFLTKPVNDVALIARVRSLVRLKMVTDELRMRALTSSEIGVTDHAFEAAQDAGLAARISCWSTTASLGRADRKRAHAAHVEVEKIRRMRCFAPRKATSIS
jgi:two-component system, cell cycle response regulator